jgi:signal transduction histidine kinase
VSARHVRVVEAAVPVLVAAVIGGASGLHAQASHRPVALGLGVAAAGALAGRRRWPGYTLGVSCVLVVVLFHVDRFTGSVAVLAPAVALFSVALRRGRREQFAAGLVAIAAVLAADLARPGQLTLSQTLAHVLLVALPLLAAEVIRTHQANMRLLVERLEIADRAREQEVERRAEQERLRIARDLHDVLAHTLTEVNITAAAAAEQLEPSAARASLERIEHTSHTAIGELRAILGVLRGSDTVDPPRAPTPGISDIPGLISQARDAGLEVCFETRGAPPEPIPEATSLAAYRIVQESLTNARRHAHGAAITVCVRYDTREMSLTIENLRGAVDGKGSTSSGVGLAGMRERAAAVGGRLDARAIAGGFRVQAALPYERAA